MAENLFCYTPYSGIHDTCLVAGKSGVLYSGIRIENSSFPLTISSVQAAVCSCLANGSLPDILYIDEQSAAKNPLLPFWLRETKMAQKHPDQLPSSKNKFIPFVPRPQNIRNRLRELSKTAVVKNSGFPVSVLLKTDKGWVEGVNVEVASWQLGLCAERTAIARAIASGSKEFYEMHVYVPKSDFGSPCGACRQVLMEWMPKKPVILHHSGQTTTTHLVEHLLPYAFTANSLHKKQ